MQFHSPLFLSIFILFFWAYWLLAKEKNGQNALIVLASYAFYAWWDWRCVLLLLISSASAYCAGLLFAKPAFQDMGRKSPRGIVAFSAIVLNVGILAYFKYCDFFLSSICAVLGRDHAGLDIVLPVGISFYTFSTISYIVDAYRKQVEPTRDILACFAYISFFPGILSGPIHSASRQLPQYLKARSFDYDLSVQGVKDFIWGAFMKLCVADKLGIYVDSVFSHIAHQGGNSLLVASLSYSMQIYADFAGYSLMAIGLGRMLGITLQQNFNLPYFSRTVTEFWSRWHMSLTGWFRNYVYIPLGGNRVPRARWICNIMTVFLLSGLWHGAAWTFVIWGAIHGVVQVLEKLIYGRRIREVGSAPAAVNLFRMALTFTIVSAAWIFFRMPTTGDALEVLTRIATTRGEVSVDPVVYVGFLSLALMVVKEAMERYGNGITLMNSRHKPVRVLTCVALIVYIVLFGTLDGGSFIYFQF